MSLVVARDTGESIYIVSDTRLGPRLFQDVSASAFGAVKIQLINQHMAIGFAGNLGFAETAFREISGTTDHSEETVLSTLTRIHNLSEQQTEFLVATWRPNRSLLSIKHGNVERTTSAFIGSLPAFERYQQYWHSEREPPQHVIHGSAVLQVCLSPEEDGSDDENIIRRRDSDLYSRMFRCMTAVIADTNIPEVAGHVVPVCTHRGALRYMLYTTTITHPQDYSDLAPGASRRIEFGTAAQGGYSFHFSGLEGRHGCGMYWQQGQCGVLFFREHTEGLLSPHWLSDISPLDYIEICQQRYGATVQTMCLNEGVYWRRAEECIEAGIPRYALLYIAEAEKTIRRKIGNVTSALAVRTDDQAAQQSYMLELEKLRQLLDLKRRLQDV